jgi:hypothetical protein
MADILIRGMELPKNEPLLVKINPDGSVSTTAKNGYKKYEAVQVLPHGRLVDALYIRDGIIQKWMDMAGDSNMYKCGMEDAYEVIRNAPTIIPASEERT